MILKYCCKNYFYEVKNIFPNFIKKCIEIIIGQEFSENVVIILIVIIKKS